MAYYRRYLKSLTLLFMLLLSLVLSGCSQQPDSRPLTSLHWIEDKSDSMTFEDIIGKDLATQWNTAEDSHPNFGFTESVIWLSLPFENLSDQKASMLLEVAFPLHDRIDVYIHDGKQVIRSYRVGDQQQFVARPLNHRFFLFPQTLPARTKLRAILRIQTTDTMYLPVNIWDSDAFIEKDQIQTLILGLFFGALLIMMVYNLFLYFSTKHRDYLNYVLFVGSIIYMQLTQKNLGFQYLWPDKPFFNHISVPLSNFLAIAIGSFFLMRFLDLSQKNRPWAFYTFSSLAWVSLLGMMFACFVFHLRPELISYTAIVLSTAVIGSLATIIIIGVLISLSMNGNHSARILVIAWFSLLTGSLLFALGRIGVPMPMLLTENAMLVGSTFEAALISFALAMHIKKERDARMQAQALALENELKTRDAQNELLILQEEVTQQLEEEVKERTQKLQAAMQGLEAANNKLETLAHLDALTGLSNRRHFDHTYNNTWQSSLIRKTPVSLLMADIDYFKKLNDNYGHQFGDQCLAEVADIFKACLKNPDYLASRFGGEEFIMLLPNTELGPASEIAENIRRTIESLRLRYENQEISFTISIGVACLTPDAIMKQTELIKMADEALYNAKDAGRNRVMGPEACQFSADCLPDAPMPTLSTA